MAIANITNNILTDSGVATSSLLPLTGGTLTGALGGTSATFSSSVTSSGGRVNIQGANQNSILLNQNAGGTSTGFLIGRSFGSTDTQDFFIYDVASATRVLAIASTGAATFSSTLGIGGVADSVKGGTYTPTINTTTNIASSSVGTWQYLRVGNTVTVSGSITITPTSGVTTTSFNFSLPINSTFASGNDCAGTGVDYNATTYLMVNGNSGAANFGLGLFKSTTTSAMTLSIQFTYQII